MIELGKTTTEEIENEISLVKTNILSILRNTSPIDKNTSQTFFHNKINYEI